MIKLKKMLLTLISATLILSICPVYPNAESIERTQEGIPDALPKLETKGTTPTEVTKERTENEIVYDNHNGTMTKQIYTEPIFMEEDGKMKAIDSTLEAEKEIIEPKQTELSTQFLEKMEKGSYQTFGEKEEQLSFAFKGAKEGDKEITGKDQKAVYEENKITYPGILPDVDLRNSLFNTSSKEDLMLHQPNKIDTYLFELETKLKPEKQEDGSITFTNGQEEVIYTLPAPVMSDSNIDDLSGDAATSTALSFELKKQTKKIYQLSLKVDTEWLNAKERVYPAYIDPSIRIDKIDNANVNNANPNTNYTGSKLWDAGQDAYTLKVGRYDASTGNNQAFLKMNTSTLNQATIQSATFKVYNKWHAIKGTKNALYLDEVQADWKPSKITLNNRPAGKKIGEVNVGRAQWATFDVTKTVQAWAAGTRKNYGFKLFTEPTQDHWKKVIASENKTNFPYLEVTYAYDKPTAPTTKSSANNDGSGKGSLDVEWKAVSGATGYELLISNGDAYKSYDVGKATKWTSKGKGIFPTASELKAGKFAFHTDGKGTDLDIDPRQLYENSYDPDNPNRLLNQTYYKVKIVAKYNGGKSPVSDITKEYLPNEKMQAPKADAYSNLKQKNTGYVHLKWEASPLATGYKVLVFNGKDYESFDVGNKTSWNTQNQKIWPTKAEIEAGKYALHHDDKGTELAKDPASVYKNAGDKYKDTHHYYFRVVAYTKDKPHADSAQSDPVKPTIPDANADQLGMTDYWTSIPVRGGEVNAANGNFLFHESDFHLEGRGPSINIERTFNSQDSETGLFGSGWTSTLEDSLTEEANGNIIWIEADKKKHTFRKTGSGYAAPPGIFSEVKKTTTGYLKIEEDKSETAYNKDGKLVSEKDTNGNTLTYSYTDGKLTKITDASGRAVTISYKDTLISEITGPANKKVTFTYNKDSELVGSTTARGKQYRYGYSGGKLTAIYDPKHTEAKPYETTFEYESDRLVKIIDPVGKQTLLSYEPEKLQTTLENERKKKTIYQYNEAGNPAKTIEDAAGLKLTTSYTYDANKLIKEVSPKGQAETYQYDKDGNVISFTDAYGTEKYTYNENNDVTSVTDTENKKTTIAYDGADAVSETDKTEANTSSYTAYDTYGNPAAESNDLIASENLLLNSGFEKETLTDWTQTRSTNNTGTISLEKGFGMNNALGGGKAVKVNGATQATERNSSAATQVVEVEPNTTYTLSSFIKTKDIQKSGVFLEILQMKADKKDIAENKWANNRPTEVAANTDWVKRQLTFQTSKDTHFVRVYLRNEQKANGKGKGTAWFDNVQLEQGSTASEYNPVVNSSFEDHSGTKAVAFGRSGNMSATAGTVVEDESFSGGSSVKMQRKAAADEPTYFGQTMPINQKKALPVTITGMSKAEKVQTDGKAKLTADYSLWANVTYMDDTVEKVQAKFPMGTNDWNRSMVVVNPTKAIKEIRLLTVFRGQVTGTAWFDDFRILEGRGLTKTTYDSKGNYAIASYDEENRKTASTYDDYGNPLSSTDEKGNQQKFSYNADNELTETTLASGTKVAYSYDDNGNTTKKAVTADGKTQTHSFSYDVDNKLTTYSDPLGREIAYTYDASGNETKVALPTGHTIESTYDSADRVSGIKWDGSAAFNYEYDPNGNITKVTDHINNKETNKTYDDADRITSVNRQDGSITYSYKDSPSKDNKGKTDKVASVKVKQGAHEQTTAYTYNALDQNTIVQDGTKKAYFDYDETGNISLYTAGNGAASNFTYDNTKKVTQIAIGNKAGDPIVKESYTYDSTGNRLSITNEKLGKTTYSYNSVNELTEENLPDGTKQTYQYDGFGNRTKTTIGDKTISASYNEGNQLVEWNGEAITYDKNGNRTSDGKYTYQWDAADRLTSITKKGDSKPYVSYTYDEDNRRISKTIGTETIQYHYDGDSIDVLYETDGSGNILRQYVYSDDNIRLAMKMNGKTLYYHYNAHGDVVALTDEAGKTVANYEYDAWGNVLKSEATTTEAKANPYGYAGYTYDKEIQQYYLMARYYDPEQGVFTAIDPDPGDDDDPQTMNGYNYANNNPVMFVDPDGHWIIPALRAGGMYIAKYGGRAFKYVKKSKVGKWSKGLAKRLPQYRKARYIAKKTGANIKRSKSGKGYVLTKGKRVVRVMGRNSGGRKKPYYRMSDKKGSFDKYGNRTSSASKSHIRLHKGWKKNAVKFLGKK